MYANHVPVINAAMRDNLATFKRGIMFASISIRQSVLNVPEALAEVEELGDSSAELWGSKRLTWSWLEDGTNAAELWEDVKSAPSASYAIMALLRVPGLGIVKAGFVAQFLGFNVACLDSRNVKREGRNPNKFKSGGLTPHKLRHKVKRYLLETEGKAEFYWDTWCHDVAAARKKTADEISALHLAIVPANFVPF